MQWNLIVDPFNSTAYIRLIFKILLDALTFSRSYQFLGSTAEETCFRLATGEVKTAVFDILFVFDLRVFSSFPVSGPT